MDTCMEDEMESQHIGICRVWGVGVLVGFGPVRLRCTTQVVEVAGFSCT